MIGHSFGGKVALDYAFFAPQSKIWMLSPPGTLDEKPEDQSEVIKVIAALRAVPMPLKRKILLIV